LTSSFICRVSHVHSMSLRSSVSQKTPKSADFPTSPAPSGPDHLKKVQPLHIICSLMRSFICRHSHVHSIPLHGSVAPNP
jgi:hypothetical protein